MQKQKFFAVRVTLRDETGSTVERDFVRGETRMGCAKFAAWALGDLMLMTHENGSQESWVQFDVREISPSEVYDRRRELAR